MGNSLFFKFSFRVRIDDRVWFATLVDLPTVIEAGKTLDHVTYYKSVDVAQMLYVHNKCLTDFSQIPPQ